MVISTFNISTLNNGIDALILQGENSRDLLGNAVSVSGDINGDGFFDIIIGADNADSNGKNNSGKVYVIYGKNTSFSGFKLDDLDGSNGFVIEGINAGDLTGSSVSSLDFNRDGFSDLVIGSRAADPNNNSNAGLVHLIFGKNSSFKSSFNLASINSNYLTFNGLNSNDLTGFSVDKAGDINNDGIDDLIINARNGNVGASTKAGKSYVVFGKSNVKFDRDFDLSTLNGNNGFVINGVNQNDFSGVSVSSAGDLNGDNIDDLIIGANSADPNGKDRAGVSYVIFGRSGNFAANFNLSDLDGGNGFTISGIEAGDNSGVSVSSAGDINADGIDDVIIGAPQASPNGIVKAGSAYVVFGNSNGFIPNFDLSTLNGDNGFTINGISTDDLLGTSVSGAGDVNGDGIDDIIVGARNVDTATHTDAGTSYIIYGSEKKFAATLNLSDLKSNQGYGIEGRTTAAFSGTAVSGGDDINGDGIDDVIIGAPQAQVKTLENVGESYVVFGRDERSLLIENYVKAPSGEVNTTDVKGIPITLNNGKGVSEIEFTFSFDPQLLRVKNVITEADLAGWNQTVTRDISGQVKVTLTGSPLTQGAKNLVFLDLEVPQNAAYGAVNSLSLESVLLNDGKFNVIGDSATHLVAEVGDVNGDRALTAADAVAISRLATGIDSEFSAYPGVDPLLIGDLNGDGVISAFDASLVAFPR